MAILLLLVEWMLSVESTSGVVTLATSVAAVAYAGIPLAMLVLLRQAPTESVSFVLPFGTSIVSLGSVWVFAVLSITWTVDTFAYLVGRTVGRHPFSPRLSPKKTWEGTVGGIVAGTATFLAWSPVLGWSILAAIAGGLIIAIACVTGDLAESALKRSAGLKDAGSLLPGHGGLLDRIDSLVFSTIVVFLLQALNQTIPVLGR